MGGFPPPLAPSGMHAMELEGRRAEVSVLSKERWAQPTRVDGAPSMQNQGESRAGAGLLLKNPWGESTVAVFRNGKAAGSAGGARIRLATERGEALVLAPPGVSLDRLRRAIA